MDRVCSTNGEKRNPFRKLLGKPEVKGLLRNPRHRRVDNIRMDLIERRRYEWTGFVLLRLAIIGGLL
jgi:hypothetical protein